MTRKEKKVNILADHVQIRKQFYDVRCSVHEMW